MTALVAVDRIEPDELVTIPEAVESLPADAARMDARVGERWKASDLVRATLAYSANDAALALALHVADDEAAFVELMNERAVDLDLEDSEFGSATGLDQAGTASTSTPADMVQLASAAMEQPAIAAAVAERTLRLTRPDGSELDPLPNRNPLLGRYAGVDGVKTGFTDAAGYTYVVHHVDDETGGELLVVTFASDSEAARAADARKLLDWARPLRQQLLLVEGGTPLGTIPVQRSDDRLELFACDDLRASVRVGQRLTQEVVVPRSIAPPVAEGDEVGTLRVRTGPPEPAGDDGGEQDAEGAPIDLDLVEVPVCAGNDVEKLEGWDRFVDRASDVGSAWRSGVDEVESAWSGLRGTS
jgi:D-alanyl-D-alanine carboxypeptidase (penicillin-binding protein 5/6)